MPATRRGQKHGTSVKTHLQSEEITLFVGSSRPFDEDEDDGTNIMTIKTDNNEYKWWVKTNKVKNIPGTIVNTFGNDYVLVKNGNTSTVYDDEGRVVLSGPLKMNLPFNSYGIASVMKRNQTVFFNTDNEYSTSPEEMVESMDRRKMATLLETKQPETPFQRYLRIASSFC
jgi:hypothetical protein